MDKCLADFAAVKLENATVFHGSNLDVLPFMADNSVDSIVTDPPYELGFMGKKWDSTGIAYSVELWRECLRVLKPGGHLLAFGGSRTWHRLAVAIEDAGFEVRDSIAWLYGSGFPKSLDISKAIDKSGATEGLAIRKEIQRLIISSGLTDERIAKVASVSPALVRFWRLGERSIQTAEAERITKLLGSKVPQGAEREVIGQTTKARSSSGNSALPTVGGKTIYTTWDETAPATPEAQKWAGWGTALKPAFEPIVVARKPLIGTVAENVLQWGVGGLNIDGTRIATVNENFDNLQGRPIQKLATRRDGETDEEYRSRVLESPAQQQALEKLKSLGRWPANIILDEYTAGLLDEQSGHLHGDGNKKDTANGTDRSYQASSYQVSYQGRANRSHGDSGGASRFFYVSKASKRDRNEGLDELPIVKAGSYDGNAGNSGQRLSGKGELIETPKRQNFHPTVKPTDLMRYLIKLVTPAGGIVLDPFTGSGSTGKAALLDGYQFLGIELTDDYLPIIEGRLKWAEGQAQAEAEKAAEKEKETLF